MSAPRTAARYHARDGTAHTVIVYRTPAGRWRVIDTAGEDAVIVETLTGHDDRLSQAQAARPRLRRRATGLPRRRPARGPAPAAAAHRARRTRRTREPVKAA